MNQMFGGEVKSLVDAVTQTALNYRLLSQYTAFVAVSDEVRVNPDGSKITVQVPVELPQGVSYEGVFGDLAAEQAVNAPRSRSMRPAAPMPSQSFSTSSKLQGSGLSAEPSITGADQLQTRLKPNSSNIGRAEDKTIAQSPIQVVKLTGLTGTDVATAQAAIAKQLQAVTVPTGLNGNVILEITVQNGRLTRIILDDVNSTLKDQNLVESLKRSLQGVVLPNTAKGIITLTLSVKPS
jgi:Ca-activated chloride channel family protein